MFRKKHHLVIKGDPLTPTINEAWAKMIQCLEEGRARESSRMLLELSPQSKAQLKREVFSVMYSHDRDEDIEKMVAYIFGCRIEVQDTISGHFVYVRGIN